MKGRTAHLAFLLPRRNIDFPLFFNQTVEHGRNGEPRCLAGSAEYRTLRQAGRHIDLEHLSLSAVPDQVNAPIALHAEGSIHLECRTLDLRANGLGRCLIVRKRFQANGRIEIHRIAAQTRFAERSQPAAGHEHPSQSPERTLKAPRLRPIAGRSPRRRR